MAGVCRRRQHERNNKSEVASCSAVPSLARADVCHVCTGSGGPTDEEEDQASVT
jgi:hypothetical protein